MGDLLSSLAGTPLPIVLAIAGLAFVFLGLGGNIGSVAGTGSIKRGFAAAVGTALIIGSAVLYLYPPGEPGPPGEPATTSSAVPQEAVPIPEEQKAVETRYRLRPVSYTHLTLPTT